MKKDTSISHSRSQNSQNFIGNNGNDNSSGIVSGNVTTISISTAERAKGDLLEGVGVDDIGLSSREVVGVEGLKEIENIEKIGKMFMRARIQTVNDILAEKDPARVVKINANDSMEQMVLKAKIADDVLYELGCADLLRERLDMDKLYRFINYANKTMGGPFVVYNGQLIATVLFSILYAKREFKIYREILLKILPNGFNGDNLSIKIDGLIGELINYRNEYYFSKFRLLLDKTINLVSKMNIFDNFSRKIDISKGNSLLFSIEDFEIRNMIHNVNYIQLVIECLHLVSKASSKENVEIAIDACQKCLDSYYSEMESIRNLEKSSGLNPSRYRIEHMNVMRLLERLIQELKKSIRSVNQKSSSAGKQEAKVAVKTNEEKVVVEAKKSEEPEAGKAAKDTKEEEGALLEEDVVLPVDVEEVEEENFEDIERETNELMELFRQFIEGDREEKLKLKEEARLRAMAKKTTTATTTAQVQAVVNGGPRVIKLNGDHPNTVRMLFQDIPPHYIIKGSEVESLIKILGGRIEKKGGGITIHWGTSKKIAGTYEVAHGGSEKGLLTSQWAANVAEAINVGIDKGYIASETIRCLIPIR